MCNLLKCTVHYLSKLQTCSLVSIFLSLVRTGLEIFKNGECRGSVQVF